MGCLKKVRFHHATRFLPLGHWNLCSNCAPLQPRAHRLHRILGRGSNLLGFTSVLSLYLSNCYWGADFTGNRRS